MLNLNFYSKQTNLQFCHIFTNSVHLYKNLVAWQIWRNFFIYVTWNIDTMCNFSFIIYLVDKSCMLTSLLRPRTSRCRKAQGWRQPPRSSDPRGKYPRIRGRGRRNRYRWRAERTGWPRTATVGRLRTRTSSPPRRFLVRERNTIKWISIYNHVHLLRGLPTLQFFM